MAASLASKSRDSVASAINQAGVKNANFVSVMG
jgi:hypothetical protein